MEAVIRHTHPGLPKWQTTVDEAQPKITGLRTITSDHTLILQRHSLSPASVLLNICQDTKATKVIHGLFTKANDAITDTQL